MYCVVAYTDLKEYLLKYLRARTHIYHWVVGTASTQNYWFIWYYKAADHFSHSNIGTFLYRNKGKFTSRYYSNNGSLPVSKLYAYEDTLSEPDMVKCVVEKDVAINENDCCFPPHFDKGVLQRCFDNYINIEQMKVKVKNIHGSTPSNDTTLSWDELDIEIENAERYVQHLKQTKRDQDGLILKTIDTDEMNHLLDSYL